MRRQASGVRCPFEITKKNQPDIIRHIELAPVCIPDSCTVEQCLHFTVEYKQLTECTVLFSSAQTHVLVQIYFACYRDRLQIFLMIHSILIQNNHHMGVWNEATNCIVPVDSELVTRYEIFPKIFKLFGSDVCDALFKKILIIKES